MSAAVSASMAALAAAEAERAAEEHRQACIAMMPTFRDLDASVDSKKSYAGCVELVYPQPMTPEAHHALQVCTLLVIACALLGAWFGRHSSDDIVDMSFRGFFWGVGGVLAIGAYYFLCFVF